MKLPTKIVFIIAKSLDDNRELATLAIIVLVQVWTWWALQNKASKRY